MDSPAWAGRASTGLDERKDGRSQRWSLANNLPANAADLQKAVHGAGEWSSPSPASRLVCFHPVPVALSGFSASGRGNYAQAALIDRAIFMGRTRYRRQIDLLSHHIS